MDIFLRSRQQTRGVWKSAPAPPQRCVGFAEFRKPWRHFAESRPFAAEPGGRRPREPPQLRMAERRYIYAIDHGNMGCGTPLPPPNQAAASIALLFVGFFGFARGCDGFVSLVFFARSALVSRGGVVSWFLPPPAPGVGFVRYADVSLVLFYARDRCWICPRQRRFRAFWIRAPFLRFGR